MLTPFRPHLQKYRIILASQSPRRSDLLEKLQLPFEVIPSEFEENLDKSIFPTPEAYVVENAKLKALDVATRLGLDGSSAPFLIIGADTVVVYENEILEKPKSTQQATAMLEQLSGSTHRVFSGVALITNSKAKTFAEQTHVTFGKLHPETIQSYVESRDGMDKAGGYGIQSPQSSSFVQKIDGCYNNVIGFPVHRFCSELPAML